MRQVLSVCGEEKTIIGRTELWEIFYCHEVWAWKFVMQKNTLPGLSWPLVANDLHWSLGTDQHVNHLASPWLRISPGDAPIVEMGCHLLLIWCILIGGFALGKSCECLVPSAGFKVEGRYQAVNNVADGLDSIVFVGRKSRAVIKESQSSSSCKGSFPGAKTMRLRRAWLMSHGGTHCAAVNGPLTPLPSTPLPFVRLGCHDTSQACSLVASPPLSLFLRGDGLNYDAENITWQSNMEIISTACSLPSPASAV